MLCVHALSGKAVRAILECFFMSIRTHLASRRAPALALLGCATAALSAAHAVEINPVVITAARIEQPLSQVLPAVSVLTRQDIDKSQALTLADLLRGEPGFEFARNGGPGTTTSFFLRGQNSINLVVMVDGVRSQVDSIGALQVIDVPLSQIERIEILRGNASALYGDAAIGGVIHIVTRQERQAPAPYGSLVLGSRNTSEVTAGYGGRVDTVAWDLQAGRQHTDGFSALNPVQRPTANPDADGHTHEFLSARIERRLGEDGRVGLRLQGSRARTDTDNAWADSPQDVHRFDKRNQSGGAHWRQAFGPGWISQLDVSTASLTYEDLLNGRRLDSYGRFDGRQHSARWFNTWQALPDAVVSFGAEASEDRFEVDQGEAYRMKRSGSGVFAGLNQRLEAWTLQVNVRHDRITTDHADPWGPAASATSSASTGLLGLGYALSPQWSLTATMSSGFRAPTASEVSKNQTLAPETHRSAELGASFSSGPMLARLVTFDTRTQDAIVFKPLEGWNYTYESIGRLHNRGLEASLRAYWLGHTVKASWVAQSPWNEVLDKPLDRRARRHGSFDISRPWGPYEVGAQLLASGSRSDGAQTLGGYALWSFYASRRVNDQWVARVRLDNALDKAYQLAYGYNTPGRGLFATLQYSPK